MNKKIVFELIVSTVEGAHLHTFRSFAPGAFMILFGEFDSRFSSRSTGYHCIPRFNYSPQFNDGKDYIYDQFFVNAKGRFPYAKFVQTLKLQFVKHEYEYLEKLF